jgi:hypothetical protein
MGTSFFKKYPLLAIIHHLPPIYHHPASSYKHRDFGGLVVDWRIIIKILLNILHLRGVAGLCVRLLVGVSDRENIVQFIIRGDIEAVKEELALLIGQQETYGSL